MVGRPPKPQQIKTLEGNRARREIPPEVPADGLPELPAVLNEIATEHWVKVTSEIDGWGIAKRVDSHALEQMCRYWALWQAAMSVAERDPIDKDARLAVSTYSECWRKFAIEFGLTPVARAKLAIQEQKKTDDLGDFLKVV